MAFPLSISGSLKVRAAVFPEGGSAVARLQEALVAQTVDALAVEAGTIHFRPRTKGNEHKRRPEGGLWMLNGLGPSWLTVQQNDRDVEVQYHLNTRLLFLLVSSMAFLVGLAVYLFGKVDRHWGWVFAAGLWTVMFASAYVSKRLEFRRWLIANLTACEMPATKPLRVPAELD